MRKPALSIAVAIAAIATLASPVMAGAGAWTITGIRNVAGADLQDADFSGQNTAALWSEPGRTRSRT